MALKRISLKGEDFDISYEIINKESKKDLIILHGWGANKELMRNSLTDLSFCQMWLPISIWLEKFIFSILLDKNV